MFCGIWFSPNHLNSTLSALSTIFPVAEVTLNAMIIFVRSEVCSMRPSTISPTFTSRFVSSLNSRFRACFSVSFSSMCPPGTCHLPLKGSMLRFRSRVLPFLV